MKIYILRMTLHLKRIFKKGQKDKVEMELLIQENYDLIKNIRLNRMKFYKHYRKASELR
jgi:hypothetical protein